MGLSKKDLKLVFELDSNYRTPYSRIGKKIGMSQQLVSYKVKSLSSNGVILSNMPLIDYSRFGYLSFRVYFKINFANRKKFNEMVSEMKRNPGITSIIECEGRYDLMLTFTTRNPSNFNKGLRELIASNPDQLKNCMILTTVVEHHYPRKYLVGYRNYDDTIIGGDREIVNINKTDIKILRSLMEGKKNVIDISKHSGVTPKTVISKLRKLESMGIIQGYRTVIDTQKMGFLTSKLLIKYQSVSVDREKELRNFCRANSNITEFTKVFGEWDLELTIETRTQQEFRNIYMKLREDFEDIIYDFDKFSVFGFHKRSTVPGELFEGIRS